MIARLVRSADFERVLRTRTRVNTAHFAVHHVADSPSVPLKAAAKGESSKLSTAAQQSYTQPVDDLNNSTDPSNVALDVAVARTTTGSIWLGAVVPKRHARRSVTRTLLKRQIRSAVQGHADRLAGGLWVIRLRAPFDRKQFESAASDALRRSVREELETLMRGAARHVVVA